MSEFTPWFPITTKPARDGVYQVKYYSVEQTAAWTSFSKFERGYWHLTAATPREADNSRHQSVDCYTKNNNFRVTDWRGITQGAHHEK